MVRKRQSVVSTCTCFDPGLRWTTPRLLLVPINGANGDEWWGKEREGGEIGTSKEIFFLFLQKDPTRVFSSKDPYLSGELGG